MDSTPFACLWDNNNMDDSDCNQVAVLDTYGMDIGNDKSSVQQTQCVACDFHYFPAELVCFVRNCFWNIAAVFPVPKQMNSIFA